MFAANFFDFNLKENDINIKALLLMPTINSNEKIPLLQFVYGGPSAHLVKDSWFRLIFYY